MKRFLFLCMWGLGMNVSGQSSFQIDHGPYLQEMRQDGVTVVFHTSKSSFSRLEVRERGSSASQSYYEAAHGLRNADAQFFKIRTEDLKAGTEYEYRICTKEVKSFQPYKVVFGDSLTSKWYSFKTIDPHQKGASIFITSDIHNRPELLEKLLRYCDYQTCTSFFYAGDMMNYMEKSSNENPFSAFIDTSVKLFASSVPFEVVRGNHETRGNLARTFPSYFPKSDGKVYGSYLLGDVMVVMLDCGEDKADSHPVYAGFTDYSAYRVEQRKWLEALVKSKEYKKARYHIVICHFPLAIPEEEAKKNVFWGWKEVRDTFLPLLNKADVDLLVSGHTHRFFYHAPNTVENTFPMLEQGYDSAVRLDLSDGKISMKVVNKDGKEIYDKTLKIK